MPAAERGRATDLLKQSQVLIVTFDWEVCFGRNSGTM